MSFLDNWHSTRNSEPSAFAALITPDIFFDLAKTCHSIHTNDSSLSLKERLGIAIKCESNARHFNTLCTRLTQDFLKRGEIKKLSAEGQLDGLAQIHKKLVGVLPQVLFSLVNQLSLVCDEQMQHFEKFPLHYRRYNEADSPFHNQSVDTARAVLRKFLAARLREHFSAWEEKEVEALLAEVPPLTLLEEEYSPLEKSIRGKVPLTWIVAFLRSQFIWYLGCDLLPENLGHAELYYTEALHVFWRALRDHHPRYTSASHKELFDQIKYQSPFREAYDEAMTDLAPLCADRHALEDALLAITFKFSLPYARDFVTAPGLYENLVNKLTSGFVVTKWIVQIGADLAGYNNPSHISEAGLMVIAYYSPIVAELMEVAGAGTDDLEGHTQLDYSRSAPDEEFDD